jgi:hypothetical protein
MQWRVRYYTRVWHLLQPKTQPILLPFRLHCKKSKAYLLLKHISKYQYCMTDKLIDIYLRKACSFVEQKDLGFVKKVYSARRYTSSKAALNDKR